MSACAAAADSSTGCARKLVTVLGCRIDVVSMEEAVAICEDAVRSQRTVQHMAINAAKLIALRSDPQLREVVESCELVTADGQAVVWASRLLGAPLPERVAGIDLMQGLLHSAERDGHSVYILGARAEVLEQAIRNIRNAHPRLRIAGYRDGYFEASEEPAVAGEIAALAPDMLFVAISSPRKERFLGRHRQALEVPFLMGVGGAIDVVAGVTRRAPRWMQRLGLEWLYRLLQEPRRLLRRYATTNALFAALTAKAVLQGRLARLRTDTRADAGRR